MDLERYLDIRPARRVAVIGDAMLDVVVDGITARICREAPVPLVEVTRRTTTPGGAANVAMNLAALGADVEFVTVVGDDPAGEEVLERLTSAGVDVSSAVVERCRRTLTIQRIRCLEHLVLRLDDGDRQPIAPPVDARVDRRARRAVDRADVVVLSDYEAGTTPRRLREMLTGRRVPLIVDAKHLGRYRALAPEAVTPNWTEALALLGDDATDDDRTEDRPAGGAGGARHGRDRAAFLVRHAAELLARSGAASVAVTLDRDGAVLLDRDGSAHRAWSRPVPGAPGVGAGDAFVAGFALALGGGASRGDAVELGTRVGSVAVAKGLTSTCSVDELRRALRGAGKVASDLGDLVDRLAPQRRAGRRIVLVNGCFDLIHAGHVAVLEAARGLGDVLVVAVNSDDGVRRLKGPGRPVNSAADRLGVLAALGPVDHLVLFEEDTAETVLQAVRPDVYAKGGDYREDRLPEADMARATGAELRILPEFADRSTAQLIERILALPGGGAG